MASACPALIPALLIAAFGACAPPAGGALPNEDREAVTMEAAAPAGPDWAKNLPIYEADLRRQTKQGTIKAFEHRLDDLKKLGVGILWLMPIHPIGRKKAWGSVYAIRDFYGIRRRLGTKEDFKHLIQRAHDMDMYVIMDWVANHTSWDHPLITEHPEWYRKKDGRIVQAGPWEDIAQLDYRNRQLWRWMFQAMRYWVEKFNVDGFRCDVAGWVPMRFWQWSRGILDQYRPIFMLAEAEGPRFHPTFDATYDWTLMPIFWKIVHFDRPATIIDDMLVREHAAYPPGAMRMRHMTEHMIAAKGFSTASARHIDDAFLRTVPLPMKYGRGDTAFAVLTATLPRSKPMLWNGQEIGIIHHTPRPIPWQDSPYLDFYEKLLNLYQNNPALWRGSFTKLQSTNDEAIYAFMRQYQEHAVLVLLNLSDREQSVTVDLPAANGQYRELFSGHERTLAPAESFDLSAWDHRIYVRQAP